MLTSLPSLSHASIRCPKPSKRTHTFPILSKTLHVFYKRLQSLSKCSQQRRNVPNASPTHPNQSEASKRSQNASERFQKADALPNALRRSKNDLTDEKSILHGWPNHLCTWDKQKNTWPNQEANQPSTCGYAIVPSLHWAIAICNWSCVVALWASKGYCAHGSSHYECVVILDCGVSYH